MRIGIPTELGVTGLVSVKGQGGRIKTNPGYSVNGYTIDIADFNDAYLEQFSYIYVLLDSVTTPASTLATSSFSISFLDTPTQTLIES